MGPADAPTSGVVIVVSDGWDRGDPALVAVESARLRRNCHRLIWLNPLAGTAGYQPLAAGCVRRSRTSTISSPPARSRASSGWARSWAVRGPPTSGGVARPRPMSAAVAAARERLRPDHHRHAADPQAAPKITQPHAMIPAAFEYERATSLDEALDLLARHGGDAKVIAGGQSLLPLMKLRLARPERLIDIAASAASVRLAGWGGLAIGALTTYAELLEDEVIGRFGVFADALPRIGDVQVRNRGTIGGSVAHADPAADLPPVLLALDAVVVIRSAGRGERTIEVADFFEGAFTTALAEDELLTEIRLPAPSGGVGSAYQALEQRASGYAIAGVAAVVGRAGSGAGDGPVRGTDARASDLVRLAVTGVGDRPYRATAAEAALAGTNGDDARWRRPSPTSPTAWRSAATSTPMPSTAPR